MVINKHHTIHKSNTLATNPKSRTNRIFSFLNHFLPLYTFFFKMVLKI
jgi:hypothetical protein